MTPSKKEASAIRMASSNALRGITSKWGYRLQESDFDEIVALSSAKACSAFGSFDPVKASLETWVARITRNTLLDFLRKAKRAAEPTEKVGEELTDKEADIPLLESESLSALLSAIGSLPKVHREVIDLLSEGKRPAEIAPILGCSQNAATIKCFRARAALREKLSSRRGK